MIMCVSAVLLIVVMMVMAMISERASERDRERWTGKERERQTDRQTDRLCVHCVCVHVCVQLPKCNRIGRTDTRWTMWEEERYLLAVVTSEAADEVLPL